jgi:hypothetical protein
MGVIDLDFSPPPPHGGDPSSERRGESPYRFDLPSERKREAVPVLYEQIHV